MSADRAGNIARSGFFVGHKNHIVAVFTKPMSFSFGHNYSTRFLTLASALRALATARAPVMAAFP